MNDSLRVMAHVTPTDEAPQDVQKVLVGNSEFDSASFDTDDRFVIGFAQDSNFFDVELPQGESADPRAELDPNDPHDTPSADHLSQLASDSAVEAADANEEAIRKVAGGAVGAPEEADVQDAVSGALRNVGVDDPAKFPEGAKSARRTVSPEAAKEPTPERSVSSPPFGGGE